MFLVNGYFQGFLARGGARNLVQMLVLLWLASNLLRHRKVFFGTLYMLGASCVALSVLQLRGTVTRVLGESGRMSALGEDPNSLGTVLSLGLLAVLYIGYGRRATEGSVARVAAWLAFGVIALAVVQTGSRGASVALACGLGVLVLKKGSAWLRLRNALVAATALAVLVIMVASVDVSRRRWEVAVEGRTMAGRERIYPAAWQMFLERPLLGWGAESHVIELGSRTGTPRRDTHNLYLAVLTEDGLVGSIPYFLGLWLCCRAAWRGRRLSYGLVPLALLTTVLIINLDLTWQSRKLQWLIFALALASERPLQPARKLCPVAGSVHGAGLRQQIPGRKRTAGGGGHA
ncbi:MAG: O-antigen ligase family protein [Thermoanaerobaculia bacterium]